MSIYFPHALFIQTILTSPYLSYLCFCVMLYKFVNKVPRSFQNLFSSFSSVPLAKCRDRKFCLSSVSSRFFGGSAQPAKQRINFYSDLCAVAFRICVRINALLILRVKVFGRFSKNTKSKVMTSPALRLPPELPFIFADPLTTLRCIEP